ncbi:putative late blight resistance protein-R1B-16-like protein [Hordeum vulgare]|nr:putative late blight resistance protein-R1B-16-like protein [Hordeum vulgare]
MDAEAVASNGGLHGWLSGRPRGSGDGSISHVGGTMDFDASSGEEYGQTELDQLIQDELFDSSDLDEDVDMMILMSTQEEMDREVEHILNFKGSIKGRRVINQNRVSGAKQLQKDFS